MTITAIVLVSATCAFIAGFLGGAGLMMVVATRGIRLPW